jgi:hypothetical protein
MNETNKKLNFNKLLHCLTNRRSNFKSPCFPSNEDFFPDKQTEEWMDLHRLLMLDRECTDYYIKLALSTLDSHADIKARIDPGLETYLPHKDFVMESTVIEGASFIHAHDKYSKSVEYSYKFPIPCEFTVEWFDQMVKVHTDTQLSYLQDVDISHINTKKTMLTFDWTKDLPFKGTILFEDGNWNVDICKFKIKYVPHKIDISAWIKDVEYKFNVEEFLNKSKVFTLYSVSRNSYEKLAYLYASLVDQHKGWKDEV